MAAEALNSLEHYDTSATFTIKQVIDYLYTQLQQKPKELEDM